MTSSERPTEPSRPPGARARGGLPLPPWLLAAVVVPPGWVYVLHNQRWHLTASAVMLMLCWLAIVATGFWGMRMALSAATDTDEGWFSVRGRRDELEREKRSLLKAIKEIEFDLETGKLSKDDAAALTVSYRARAIEVIKAIEAVDAEASAKPREVSVREQILADARARSAVDKKAKKKSRKTGEAS